MIGWKILIFLELALISAVVLFEVVIVVEVLEWLRLGIMPVVIQQSKSTLKLFSHYLPAMPYCTWARYWQSTLTSPPRHPQRLPPPFPFLPSLQTP